MTNLLYALTDHDHTENELTPWLAECVWGHWEYAAGSPIHPYECVAYDLRLLAEETDPDPRHTGGLVRHRTNYALAGFDYLTFAA